MALLVDERQVGASSTPVRPSRIKVVGSTASEGTARLVGAWRELGLPVELVSGSEALADTGPDDLVLGRVDVRRTLDGVEPGLLALLLIERRGVRVLNSARSLLRVHDKLRTARILQALGLPHPHTVAVRAGDEPSLTPPLVVKPRYGSWGVDVCRCETDAEVEQCLATFADRPWYRRHGALAQALLPSPGHDLRLVVAGGMVVGATERVAAPGEWRTNVSLGGSTRPVVPDADAGELARTAALVVGVDLVGVDLAPLPGGGYALLELNGAVDFDDSYSVAGRDVFTDIAAALGILA